MEFKFSSPRGDVEAQYRELKTWASENFTYEQLIHMFAKTRLEANLYRAKADLLEKHINDLKPLDGELRRLSSEQIERETFNREKMAIHVAIQAINQGLNTGAQLIAKSMKIKAQKRGKEAADIRHGKPGGSRSKADEMRRLWASGKYTSRTRCAEEECAALGMSYDAARKALRNTPVPS